MYYVNVEIGTPPQPFRVKLDTSESACQVKSNLYQLLKVAAVQVHSTWLFRRGSKTTTGRPTARHVTQRDTRCALSATWRLAVIRDRNAPLVHADPQGYNPTTSSTASLIGCHDDECASTQAPGEGMLPSICTMQDHDGNQVCPRVPTGTGQGQCVEDPSLRTGTTGLVACQDHLNPPCSQVVNAPAPPGPQTPDGHYRCEMDMGQFGAMLAGHSLAEYCPETCGICDRDATRYCADNPAWHDEGGQGCSAYAAGQRLHNQCFAGAAYVACPVSCEACGDCCGSFDVRDDGCFFRSIYGDGSKVFGVKYQDTITLPGGIGGDARSTNLSVEQSIFGLITDEENDFEPDEEIDGVWGLGIIPPEENCNPSCGSMQPFHQFVQADGLADLFAICLDSDGISSWDIGVVDDKKYQGALDWHDVVSEQEYDIGPPTSIQVGARNQVPGSALRNIHTIVDLHMAGIGMPTALMNQFRTAFLAKVPSTFSIATLSSSDLANQGCVGPSSDDQIRTFASFVAGGDEGLAQLGLPDVTIEMPGGTLTVAPQDYLVVEADMICLAFIERQDDYLVLGRPVMEAYYTVFDRANKKVGFGVSKGLCLHGEARCEADQFECNNGECIPSEYQQDSAPDCRDESDELGPSGQPQRPVGPPPSPGMGSHRLDCSALQNPPNGHVQVVGRSATYSCNPGYGLRGLAARQCLPTGAWAGVDPQCIKGSASSSSNCVGDDAQCEAYLSAGITCATIELMSLDCHCACDSAAAVCDESVVRNGCSDPSVVTSDNLCGNSCALAVMNQWDNCANDRAVQQIMSTFANVRDYCSSGGGH